LSALSSSSLDYYPSSPSAHDSTIPARNIKKLYEKKAQEYNEKLYNK